MRSSVPSVVVIQERHVGHGEKFKVMKVNSRRKREYVAKFLSSKKFTFRCKSKQVVIGRRTKELRYKGSPMAISRLLLLDGLRDIFPQFSQTKKTASTDSGQHLADSDSSSTSINPPLSFFNLSDRRPNTAKGASASTSAGSVSKHQVDVTCSPHSLCDFRLLFGSDTADSEEDSDTCETESVVVEVDDTLFPSKNDTDRRRQISIDNSIQKIENDVNQIANKIKSALEAAAQKVTVTFPQQNASANPTQSLHNTENSTECISSIQRNQLNYSNSELIQRNNNHTAHINCLHIQPCGSLPFFRVPGGCLMVVQATNQTTPVLYGTFITGCAYRQQYQQVQLPIYGMNQAVSIHIGPYRLSREEVNGLFNFVTNAHHSFNPRRF